MFYIMAGNMKKTTPLRAAFITLLILFIPAARLGAKEGLNADAGFRIIYAEDENVLQNYYRVFAGAGWSSEYYNVKVSYDRWISYAVTDELLNTLEINIHQPELSVTLYPSDELSIDAAYSCFSGDSSYAAHRVDGGVFVDMEDYDFAADLSYKDTRYDFPAEINNSSLAAGVELSFDINDRASWDFSYEYTRTDYSTFGNIYAKHTLRTGFVYISSINLFFMGGLSGGADSSDVFSLMADAGITVKLYDHVRLSGIYMFTADFYETSTGGGGPSSGSTISSDISHTGSVSVSLYL